MISLFSKFYCFFIQKVFLKSALTNISCLTVHKLLETTNTTTTPPPPPQHPHHNTSHNKTSLQPFDYQHQKQKQPNAESNSRPSDEVTNERYKTELCRKFMENGSCPYGKKCQFAHGYHELRPVSRHPRRVVVWGCWGGWLWWFAVMGCCSGVLLWWFFVVICCGGLL